MLSLDKIRSSTKRILGTSMLVGTLVASPLLTGCGEMSAGTQARGIPESLQEQWPIWEPDDLELNKHNGPIVTYGVTVFMKPKYYNGPMPLEYKSSKTLGAGSMTDLSRVLRHQFEDFSNYFIYEDFFNLVGAVSVNNNNMVVAEAKINRYARGEGDTYRFKVEVEEFHYDGGLLVFHCKSQFEPNLGAKEEEIKCLGKKQRDYFFILPLGISR